VVGGYVNAGYDQGRMAGELAIKIFGGKTQFTDNDIGKPGFTWVFNYEILRRFGIPLSSLPENSKIVGKPVNLLTQHPLLAATVLAGIALHKRCSSCTCSQYPGVHCSHPGLSGK
jgi:ABC-type uncharacterized transport system substrate-binding protein